jgi:DNA-binding MarR family transcriptional regulator
MTTELHSNTQDSMPTSFENGQIRRSAQAQAPAVVEASIPQRTLMELLIRMNLQLRLRGVGLEAISGLSGRELDLVALLGASGPTSVKSLVADLGVPRSTMTAIIDRLEDRGIVKRLPNPQDRRSVILEPTPEAIQALMRYREGMMGFVEHIDSVLGNDERDKLTRVIQRLADSF